MTSSFFSDLDATPSTQEQGSSFFSDLEQEPSRTRSLISAPIKGLLRGARSFSPLPSFGPIPSKLAERVTEHVLPTQKNQAEDVLELIAEHVPLAALGQGGIAKKGIQAISGGLAKKTAKDIELPEWAQDIIGGIGVSVPSLASTALSKTLQPAKGKKAIVDFLRSQGLSEKEITPIIQDKKKLGFLSKAAMKYEEKSPFLKGVQDKLGNIYEGIRKEGQSINPLEGRKLVDFENDFHKILDKLPRRHRRLIEKEIEELFNNPIDFTSLHDFNIAINDIIKGTTGGKASIGKLKEATHRAQKNLDSKLFKNLRQTDAAYSKLIDFTDRMTKKNWEGLIKLGDAGKVVLGALLFNPAMMGVGIKGALAVGSIRYSLKQLLTNPRLQNVHKKLQEAITKNNFSQALKLSEILREELEDKISIKEKNEPQKS